MAPESITHVLINLGYESIYFSSKTTESLLSCCFFFIQLVLRFKYISNLIYIYIYIFVLKIIYIKRDLFEHIKEKENSSYHGVR